MNTSNEDKARRYRATALFHARIADAFRAVGDLKSALAAEKARSVANTQADALLLLGHEITEG